MLHDMIWGEGGGGEMEMSLYFRHWKSFEKS